ncbi:MAG: sulfatase-like hydrolase/transferase [Opitutae bacterium]|nr:sulfatase-like hydrolase/transferase [Opitutae bacterium]
MKPIQSIILFCVALTQVALAQGKPNILYIMVDDLGFGDLSSHGATDLKSPNIDKLMKEGMRFDNFYANCPVCSPTRAAAMTGRYPDIAGVPGVVRTHESNNWGYLNPKLPTLPALLKTVGYHTAHVGKWHLGLEQENHPNKRGFDHFHGFLGDMMDDYYKHTRHGQHYMRLNQNDIRPKGHATDLFTDWSSDYLHSRAKSKDKNPFFLYLAYNAPHTPIQPPRDWLDKVKTREKDISDQRARLVALIEHMDGGIGKVLRVLKETGLSKNTLVIFTSDNGGQVNVGGRNGIYKGGKQEMDDGGIRSTTCVVWPSRIKPDSRTSVVALTMDLTATLLEIAGIKVNHKIDGISLLPTLSGKKQDLTQRYIVWMRLEGNAKYQGRTYYAIRQGDWKLTQNTAFENMRLYNLSKDPKETIEVKNAQGIKRKLTNELMKHIHRAGEIPWQGTRNVD